MEDSTRESLSVEWSPYRCSIRRHIVKDDFAAEWLDLVTALAPEQCLDVATRIASRLNGLHEWHDRRRQPYTLVPGADLSCASAPLFEGTTTYKERDRLMAHLDPLFKNGWLAKHEDGIVITTPNPLPTGRAHIAGLSKERRETPRSRNSISIRTKTRVFARDEFRCWLCGMKVETDPESWNIRDWGAVVDHVIPHAHGGSNRIDNLKTAHIWCNLVRGDKEPPDPTAMRYRAIFRTNAQLGLWCALDYPEVTLAQISRDGLDVFSSADLKTFMREFQRTRNIAA